MKASTSGTTTAKSNESKKGFVNDALPNPQDEPAITDSRFLDASINAIKRHTENAEREYRERGPVVVAENRNSTAQLYNKYCEDEERKRQETHKAKEAYHQPVTVTPIARGAQDRKRRQTDIEDDWVKRQQQGQGQHQQLNHWMGPPPPAYHQYHPHQQYMMMQQQQQQQQQMPRTFPSTSSAAPSTPQDSNSSVNTPQQQQLMQSSPPSIGNAPVQPSTSADLQFCTTAGSSPPKAIDDLSDLPTPRENVDFLAAESEFRCDKDEIKDLGPDIFDEFFSDMTPSSSSPMGAPMFSSTPVPTPTAQAQSSRTFPVGYEMEQQHQLQLQQQQQQMMIQQQQREMYMKQQAMYAANGYGQAPTTAQQQQHAQYIHHMRMQQMRYQQQQNGMMDPRMMSYYQQQHPMAANGVVPQHHPMYHQQLHHQHQQFAPHPMN